MTSGFLEPTNHSEPATNLKNAVGRNLIDGLNYAK
jgi:hypothetical protein